MSCESAPRNFFSNLGFRFVCDQLPNIEYLIQKVTIPGVNLGTAITPAPFVPIFNPGNMTYGEFSIEFKLDENLKAYDEVLDWMEALGHPDNLNPQYEEIIKDIRLIVLTSSYTPLRDLTFTDAYPTFLSEINFDTTLTDVPYISCTANFKFQRIKRNPV